MVGYIAIGGTVISGLAGLIVGIGALVRESRRNGVTRVEVGGKELDVKLPPERVEALLSPHAVETTTSTVPSLDA